MKLNFVKTVFLSVFLFGFLFSNAQDWANLKRYQHDNDSLQSLPLPKNRVVFMGNSITQGWVDQHPAFFQKNSYVGRGIGGQTSPQMLLRFRQDVLRLHPKAVVILAGTNDIAGNTGPSVLEMILDNIASMAELAKANGVVPILCSVLPAYDYPWRKGLEPNVKIPKLNAMLKAYAKKKGFVYVDYFSAMAQPNNAMIAEYTYDGVHCTSKGYDVMEKIIVPVINKIPNTK